MTKNQKRRERAQQNVLKLANAKKERRENFWPAMIGVVLYIVVFTLIYTPPTKEEVNLNHDAIQQFIRTPFRVVAVPMNAISKLVGEGDIKAVADIPHDMINEFVSPFSTKKEEDESQALVDSIIAHGS